MEEEVYDNKRSCEWNKKISCVELLSILWGTLSSFSSGLCLHLFTESVSNHRAARRVMKCWFTKDMATSQLASVAFTLRWIFPLLQFYYMAAAAFGLFLSQWELRKGSQFYLLWTFPAVLICYLFVSYKILFESFGRPPKQSQFLVLSIVEREDINSI